MLDDLRQAVCDANRRLPGSGLVTLTWGNVSAIDRGQGLFAIKPSGVDYHGLTPDDIPLIDLDGKQVAGALRPSSDTPTHLVLYKEFPGIGAICHTHSPAATALAQAGRELPCLGTTHADHFCGPVPVVRGLTQAEVDEDYERWTGLVIARHFHQQRIDPLTMPAALQRHHAPFTWGVNADQAVENSIALEMCARMAIDTWALEPGTAEIPRHILAKHHRRKHGPDAYYGQKNRA